MNRYQIISNPEYVDPYAVNRNPDMVNTMPSVISADRYEITSTSTENAYGYTFVNFYVGDDVVATLTQLPRAIILVEETSAA